MSHIDNSTVGLIPHNGHYPFYTNTHDHKYQVIVKNEIGEENTTIKIGYFDGILKYNKIGETTNAAISLNFAQPYLESKGIENAIIVFERLGMK